MKTQTLRPICNLACRLLLTVFLAGVLPAYATVQPRVAIVTPEKSPETAQIREMLESQLSGEITVIDPSLTETVFQNTPHQNTYNLTTEEAVNIGSGIECDYFFLVKSENLRRSSFERPEYYERYMASYLVSARSGQLVDWKLFKREGATKQQADELFFAAMREEIGKIRESLRQAVENSASIENIQHPNEAPADDSPVAKTFRGPLPYKRFSPPYTPLAYLYGIAATVDAMVDIDEKGSVTNVEVTRWAGYGLDQSVTETISKMKWRPAVNDGKPLPIRVLLRYNFKKLRKD